MRENGCVEGRNISIEYRWAETEIEPFPSLAVELAGLNVDVLVASGGTRAALAAKRATSAIPIVFTAVGDPVQEGLVGARQSGVRVALDLDQDEGCGAAMIGVETFPRGLPLRRMPRRHI